MNIILGITGSVAASLTPKIKEKLEASNPDHTVKIVATKCSLFFIIKKLLRKLKVYKDKDEWPSSGYYKKGDKVPHIDLCQWADLLLIAPLTANTLADITVGKADKFLTSIARAWPTGKSGKTAKPFLVAPAMNSEMWYNPLTFDQLDILAKRYDKFKIILPRVGNLACGGEPAMGALAQIDDIVDAVNSYLPKVMLK